MIPKKTQIRYKKRLLSYEIKIPFTSLGTLSDMTEETNNAVTAGLIKMVTR